MRKIYIILLIVFSNALFGQKSTYKGRYESGNAEYQYYENENYERIYDGYFKYTEGANCQINGNYQKNLKEGKWTYTRKFNQDFTSISGIYKKGKREGAWSYTTNRYPFYSKSPQTIILNFKNDTVVGSIDLPKLKGQFDDKGNFIGKWNLKLGNDEFIAEFKSNVLFKFIERKISTGEIKAKLILSDTINLSELPSHISSKNLSTIDNYKEIIGIDDDFRPQLYSIKDFFEQVNKVLSDLQNTIENNFYFLNKVYITEARLLKESNVIDNGSHDINQPIYALAEIDKQPNYPGGADAFINYIKKNYRIPEELNIKGKVTVSFVIYKSGQLGSFQIIEDLNFETGKELIRTIKANKARWTPGVKDEKFVNTLFEVSIKL